MLYVSLKSLSGLREVCNKLHSFIHLSRIHSFIHSFMGQERVTKNLKTPPLEAL